MSGRLLLMPNLVPEPLWGRNLRALLSKASWRRLRAAVIERSGGRCEACHAAGGPLHVDEEWGYDVADEEGTQHLVRLRVLCRACDSVNHLGFTFTLGGEAALDRAIRRLAAINDVSMAEAEKIASAAFALNERRGALRWTQVLPSIAALSASYGVDLSER